MTKVLGPLWVPLTAVRWHGGGMATWPSWLQSYKMDGHGPIIRRGHHDGKDEVLMRIWNGYTFQNAYPGDWIVLDDKGAAQVYTDLEFRSKYPHRRVFREESRLMKP